MIKLCAEIIDDADIESLIEWLKTKPILTKNKLTVEFEEKFSAKLGVKHSVFCNSGSSANLLAFSALAQSGKMKNNKVVAPKFLGLLPYFLSYSLGFSLYFVTAICKI